MKIVRLLSLICLTTLAACSTSPEVRMKEPSVEGNPGAACKTHADCETPMDYLIRSSCPFESACVDGRCAVTCPMFIKNPDPSTGFNKRTSCSADADCDCGDYVTSGAAACRCIDNQCMAVMKSDATH